MDPAPHLSLSLMSLPDEIILDLCELLAPLPDIQQNLSVDPAPQTPIIALSSTNSRLRRVCWPLVFRVLRVEPIRTVQRLLKRPDWLQSTLLLQIHYSRFWIFSQEEIKTYLKATPTIIPLAPNLSSLELHIGSMTTGSDSLIPSLISSMKSLLQTPRSSSSSTPYPTITSLSLIINALPASLPLSKLLLPIASLKTLQNLRLRIHYAPDTLEALEALVPKLPPGLKALEVMTYPAHTMSWVPLLTCVAKHLLELENLTTGGRDIFLDKSQGEVELLITALSNLLPSYRSLTSLSLQLPMHSKSSPTTPPTIQDLQHAWAQTLFQSSSPLFIPGILPARFYPGLSRITFGPFSSPECRARSLGTWHVVRGVDGSVVLTELRDDSAVRWGSEGSRGTKAVVGAVTVGTNGVVNSAAGGGGTPEKGEADIPVRPVNDASGLWRGMPLYGTLTPRVPIILPDP